MADETPEDAALAELKRVHANQIGDLTAALEKERAEHAETKGLLVVSEKLWEHKWEWLRGRLKTQGVAYIMNHVPEVVDDVDGE